MVKFDFEKLGKQLGIENLEEKYKKSENLKKERQDNINKKYPLTKEDILMFCNIFHNSKLNALTRQLLPSEMMVVKGVELIPFGSRNEIVNDVAKNKLTLYFKLLQRGFIVIYLEDYKINIESDKNLKVKEILEEYRIKKDDPQTRLFVTPKGYGSSVYKEKGFFEKIKGLFSKSDKTYEFVRKGAKFFINDLLDERMKEPIQNLDYGIDFNIMMCDKDIFVGSILLEINKFNSKVDKPIQIEGLFKNIKEQIGDKNNHPGEITLSYPLSDYIESKNLFYDTLYQLHLKEYITIKEMYIVEMSINFVIEKINRFNDSIKNELYPIYERISFEGGNLKLDSKILISGKKKGDKIYELIDIIVLGIIKHKRLNIEYNELKNIYFENKKRFPYFSTSINKNGNYDLFKEKFKNEITKELKELYQENIEKLINNVFCLPYFNSSLSKEKFTFLLKENETGLVINQD